jgi:hypothetical protein
MLNLKIDNRISLYPILGAAQKREVTNAKPHNL